MPLIVIFKKHLESLLTFIRQMIERSPEILFVIDSCNVTKFKKRPLKGKTLSFHGSSTLFYAILFS